jgi:hypothetical protein
MAFGTIKTQLHANHAPTDSMPEDSFAHFSRLYYQRLDTLILTKQLIGMIKMVQRHRGMVMGTLGGNSAFRNEIAQLHIQLERRLQLLQALTSRSTGLLNNRDLENLNSAWITISRDWQEDSVIDNYELHCHLIEQLLNMLSSLGKQLEKPSSQRYKESYPHPESISSSELNLISTHEDTSFNRYTHLEVLHFAARLMPAVAEQIGRIRALATYAAASGFCDKDFATKLRYVIQCTRVNNEKLRHQTKRLENLLEGSAQLLAPLLLNSLKSYEIKLDFLLTMVENEVINTHRILTDSNRIFKLATDIIDMYFQVVDGGIQLLTQWHEQDMELWLQAS